MNILKKRNFIKLVLLLSITNSNSLIASEKANRLVDNLFLTREYQNLNSSLLDSQLTMMKQTYSLSKNETGYSLGGEICNGIEAKTNLMLDFNVAQFGLFWDYKDDENTAGMDYNKSNLTVLLLKKIGEQGHFGIGYSHRTNKYVSSAKLNSDNFIASGVYTQDFTGFRYSFIGGMDLGGYNMERTNQNTDDFFGYSLGITNLVIKDFDIQLLDYSNLSLGFRTIFWGHTEASSINSTTLNSKENFSNAFLVALDFGRTFWFTESIGITLSTTLEYEKELMNERNWEDSLKVNGTSYEYGPVCKKEDFGDLKFYLKGYLAFETGIKIGGFLKIETGRDAQVGMEIKIY